MELNYSKIFNKEILGSVDNFCDANNIDDKDNFIYTCLKQGFDIKKYGLLGKTHNDGEKDLKTDVIQEKPVEIEVIREIRVEVPVEVIKEVEKIVEVTVEKVVTKIEYISDKQNENELFGKIEHLEENIFQLNEQIVLESKIFSTKTKETAKIFQQEINKKNKEIKNLSSSLEKIKGDSLKKDMEVGELKKSIEGVNKDINNKPDIYGEDSKGGWFGSNLLKK